MKSNEKFLPKPQTVINCHMRKNKTEQREEKTNLSLEFPLSKEDLMTLKMKQRKIKNRISAKNSRLRQKEMMRDLQNRVQAYSKRNLELTREIEILRNLIQCANKP